MVHSRRRLRNRHSDTQRFFLSQKILMDENQQVNCANKDIDNKDNFCNWLLRECLDDSYTLWSQNETLTSGGCSLWYILEEELLEEIQEDLFVLCF